MTSLPATGTNATPPDTLALVSDSTDPPEVRRAARGARGVEWRPVTARF